MVYIYGMEQKLSPINAIQMDNGLLIPTIPGIITVDPHAYIPCILTIAHIKLILKSHNSTLCHHVPVTLSHEKLVFLEIERSDRHYIYCIYIYPHDLTNVLGGCITYLINTLGGYPILPYYRNLYKSISGWWFGTCFYFFYIGK